MKNQDRQLLDAQRYRATQFMYENYSREERYLIVFERDFQKYLDAFSADNFKSEEKRESLRWDFYFDFQSLRERMVEFQWNKNFLTTHGINFKSVRKLYFQLFTEEERAS